MGKAREPGFPAWIGGADDHDLGLLEDLCDTGWRIGYLAADARWVPSIGYFHDLTYVCAPSPAQYGAAAGLAQLDASFYRHMSTDYQRSATCCARR